jgi:hypothetical protein
MRAALDDLARGLHVRLAGIGRRVEIAHCAAVRKRTQLTASEEKFCLHDHLPCLQNSIAGKKRIIGLKR